MRPGRKALRPLWLSCKPGIAPAVHPDAHPAGAPYAPHPLHKVTGWPHRKPDPSFDQRIAAIESADHYARAGRATVMCIDEKTAVSVRTPLHPDTRSLDEGRRHKFEYRRAGTLSWYGLHRITGLRIGDQRSHALLTALPMFTLQTNGFATANCDCSSRSYAAWTPTPSPRGR